MPYHFARYQVFLTIIAVFVILTVITVGYKLYKTRSQADVGPALPNNNLLEYELPY